MKKNTFAFTLVFMMVISNSAFSAQGIETSNNSTGSSVKDSADKSQSSNSSGQMMSYLQGAMHIGTGVYLLSSKCGLHVQYGCVLGPIQLAMGALSLAQGKEHGSAASSAGLTSGLTDGLGNPYATGNYDVDRALDGDTAFKSLKDNLAKAQKEGWLNIDTGKITTPDGKTYNVEDFKSPESMAKAGIPQGAINSAMDYAAKVSKEVEDKAKKIGAMTAANGYAEGGGSGGGGSGSGYASSDDEDGGQFGSLAGKNANGLLNRDPAQVAGMQKNYNGDPIGVAGDSIFLMMNRRYKVKESQDSFYSELDLKGK